MTRRQLLQTGLGGAALLVVAGVGYGLATHDSVPPADPAHTFVILDDEGRAIVAAIAPIMLAGALPDDAPAHDNAVVQVVAGFDTAVAALPLAVQDEVRQLFSLLGFPLTRALAAGVTSSWSSASADQIAGFLKRWQFSSNALLRSGYQALHQLILASWYANPLSWRRIGYPGPPAVK